MVEMAISMLRRGTAKRMAIGLMSSDIRTRCSSASVLSQVAQADGLIHRLEQRRENQTVGDFSHADKEHPDNVKR